MPRCHPALLLEEVIQLLFSFLSQSELAAAARTCDAWKDLALDILWRDVQLQDLLNVVCPLTRVSEDRNIFTNRHMTMVCEF